MCCVPWKEDEEREVVERPYSQMIGRMRLVWILLGLVGETRLTEESLTTRIGCFGYGLRGGTGNGNERSVVLTWTFSAGRRTAAVIFSWFVVIFFFIRLYFPTQHLQETSRRYSGVYKRGEEKRNKKKESK